MELWGKRHFAQRGMLKFTYKNLYIHRPFSNNKKGIWEIFVLKVQTIGTSFGGSSTHKILLFWKTPKSQFLVVFQSSSS
jgi:hypothetical protein